MNLVCVQDINEWLADFCRTDNSDRTEDDREWRYVRIYGVVTIEKYLKVMLETYTLDEDDLDLPEGTTHMLVVGVEFWDTSNPRVIIGNEFPCILKNGVLELNEDIDEILGRGPDLNDSTLEEATEWVKGFSIPEPTIYEELDISTVELV